jgi:hypothetical protein
MRTRVAGDWATTIKYDAETIEKATSHRRMRYRGFDVYPQRPIFEKIAPRYGLAWGRFNGAPGESRTLDLFVRNEMLYPSELRAH